MPMTSTNADAYVGYVCGSEAVAEAAPTRAAATEDASYAAVADVGPTLRWREVPSSPQTRNDTIRV